MIAESSIAAASNVDGVLVKIQAFISTAQSAAAGGLTWAEFGELMLALLRLVVSQVDEVVTMTGQQKKAFVMFAVERLFDAVADKAIPTVAYPFWLVARPVVRAVVLAIASGVCEQLIPLVRGS